MPLVPIEMPSLDRQQGTSGGSETGCGGREAGAGCGGRDGEERRRSNVGPVPDTDGVKLHADQAGLLDAQADLVVEVHQVHITRVSRIPHLANPVSGIGVVGERELVGRTDEIPTCALFMSFSFNPVAYTFEPSVGKERGKEREGKEFPTHCL